MGRTKAGKSTLHYIMCNEGREFIGKGSQRTTRFNRVFSWNKLKIIDTPGIGAGEEQGKKDEEIAWKCNNCGYIHYGTDAPEVCPLCDHPQAHFRKQDTSYI